MVDTWAEADNRKQTWNKDIKGFAKKRYVMKDLVMTTSSTSWTNSFYQKTATSLTGQTGSPIKGIPRGADFPAVERGTTLKNAIIQKYGGEGVIYWQDILTSNIRVQAETVSDVTDAVVNAIDAEIYAVLSENDTPVTINTLAITAGYEWDAAAVANRDPVQNLLDAIATVTTDRYPILTSGRGFAAMNETTYAKLMGNSRVINHPTWKGAEGIISNGTMASLVGLTIKVTPVVTNDKVLIGIAKTCGTWQQVQALTVDTIIDPQKKYTIRASEIGVTQLTDPESLCLLTNVRA